VNRSTYYKHFKEGESGREVENRALRGDILALYSRSKKRMGAYKIRQRLMVECGKRVSVGRVYRLMKSMALPKMSTAKPARARTKPEDGECANRLRQRFNPGEPNTVWVSDITYARVGGRFCYICVVIDLFSRKVIAHKTSGKNDTRLVLGAFNTARSRRGFPKGVMFHSDRGCQYTSKGFRAALDKAGYVQSFSAKGHPFDNAVAESFFKYLKKEELNRNTYNSINELDISLFEYIEGFYNKRRPHSANNFLSPDEREAAFFLR